MKDEQWDLIISIVDKALTLSGREKETYLSTVCRENPEISSEIEELLRSIEEAEEAKFLESLDQRYQELLSDMETEDGSKKEKSFIGKEFGAYRITEAIGEGGMGAVYKAERTDGDFHHTVAIKLIKQGLDSNENIRRFKMEREVLAGLHHPNIAQLYDGGINSEGIPYLVMEFVDGIPIDQYCNEHRLTIDERLDLFKDACSAIQYAHNNLVIHRDLKNNNVFVSREGVVKILDFGVAKLLADPLDETTLVETQPGQRFWTPQYAAPEQVNGEAITTATDIYMLGVLLYKLLTDQYPLDLEEKNLMEIGRAIREEAAPPPSRKIRQGDVKGCASRRSVSSPELVKTLSGDLDALTLKALRKEPGYRYHSVGQLLDDLDNYHKKLPLAARNDTIRYRIGKFFRRHKMGLSAAAVFLVLAIGFAAFYSYRITAERTQAQQEAERANQVTQFLINVFEEADPENARGDTLNAYQILERGVNRLETELAGQPAQQAAIENAIGQVYRRLGNYDHAQKLTEKSLTTRKRLYGPSHPDVAASLASLGELYQKVGDYEKADSSFREALAIIDRTYGKDHPLWFQYHNGQGQVFLEMGSYEEAETLFRNAIEQGEKIHGQIHHEVAFSYDKLARALKEQGENEAALPYTEQALLITRELYGNEHPEVAAYLANLASIYFNMGDDRTAEHYNRASLDLHKTLLGEDHPDVATAYGSLAATLSNQGQTEEAIQLHQKSLDILRRFYGEAHIDIAAVLHNLGSDLRVIGRYDEAESAYREMLSIDQELLGNEHPIIGIDKHTLAGVLRDKQLYNEAILVHKEALEVLLATLPADHRQVGHARTGYGITLLLQSNINEAETSLQDGITILVNAYTDGHWSLADARAWLGACLTKLQKYEEAEELLINAYANLQEDRGTDDRYTLQAAQHLADLYEAWNKPEKAAEYRNLLAEQQ